MSAIHALSAPQTSFLDRAGPQSWKRALISKVSRRNFRFLSFASDYRENYLNSITRSILPVKAPERAEQSIPYVRHWIALAKLTGLN